MGSPKTHCTQSQKPTPRDLPHPNHPTADFHPRIPGGLGPEIIGTAVNHHGFSHNLLHGKPVGQHHQISPAAARQQRRQIPGMAWMGRPGGVVVAAGFRKAGAFTTAAFVDVDLDAWYGKAVLWAVEEGITSGTSATTFNPEKTCNRAEVVTFLWRAAGEPKVDNSNPFVDVPDGQWFTDAVLWAAENGITEGTSDTTFAPGKVCNRAEVVTFLYRAYNEK